MLYNDERPKNFNELLGQEMNKKIFKRQIETGQYSHAYLFYGHHGSGKTTSARLLARAAICEHPTENGPCGECESCKEMENSVDYIEIDAASNTGVDAIRDKVIDAVRYQPVQLSKKIIIIDEVHMLSTSAFNALLKTIEEPPQNVIMFLCTTEVHKVPKTIVSRCQKFIFEAVGKEDIIKGLKTAKEHHSIDIEDEALEVISKAANGAMRDALSILDQFKDSKNVTREQVAEIVGFGNEDIARKIMELIEGGNRKEICDLIDKFLASSSIPILIESLLDEALDKVIDDDESIYLKLMEKLSVMRKDATPIRIKSLLISQTSEISEIIKLRDRIDRLEEMLSNNNCESINSHAIETEPIANKHECVSFGYADDSIETAAVDEIPEEVPVENAPGEVPTEQKEVVEKATENCVPEEHKKVAFNNPFGW